MASTYTTNLKLELIPTGAQSGIWGATTNVNLGSSTATQSGLEQAIVGKATLSTPDFSSNVATYTLSDSNAYQVARAFYLLIDATLTAAGTVNVPSINKPYLVFNNSAGGFAVTIKVTGLGGGVSVPNGKKTWVYTDGANNVLSAIDYLPTLALGTALPITSGGTGLSAVGANTYLLSSTGSAMTWVAPSTIPAGTATNIAGGTTGALPYQTGASTTTFLSIGTTNYVLTAGATAPQYVAQSTLTAGAATNLAGGAANRFPYQTGAGATTFLAAPTVAGSAILWDGSNLGWGLGPAATSATNLAGGSAGVVPYQSATGTTAFTAVGTAGYVLTSQGTSAPTWTLPTASASAGGAIWENTTTISSNYTLSASKNGFSVGPITISSGAAVTVPSGQRWVVY
jgi:hypothetical protein